MSFILQHRIYRSDLKNNPHILYLFGDNEMRSGKGGQARECRGEPNAIGIATKAKPSRTQDSYWSDEDYEHCQKVISKDFQPVFEHLKNGGTIVCPSDGLGTGLSELPARAPRLFAYIQEHLDECQKLSDRNI